MAALQPSRYVHSVTRSTPHIVACTRLPRTLAHSLFDEKTGSDVLLFAKDPAQTTETLLEKADIKGNVSIMGITKLKNEYKDYEKKRQLALSYDLFLADDRYVEPHHSRPMTTSFQPARCSVPWLQRTFTTGTGTLSVWETRAANITAGPSLVASLPFPGFCRCCQSCWASTSCP